MSIMHYKFSQILNPTNDKEKKRCQFFHSRELRSSETEREHFVSFSEAESELIKKPRCLLFLLVIRPFHICPNTNEINGKKSK